MWGYLAIHSTQWDYRPSTEAVSALVKYLQSQGVIGVREQGENDQYSVGPRCNEALDNGGLSIQIRFTPHLQIACGPHEVVCKHCGAEIDDWPDLFEQFYEREEEPVHRCAECGVQTPITQLDYNPGVAFGYFMLTFVQSENVEPDTRGSVWREMERILGTTLTHTYYML